MAAQCQCVDKAGRPNAQPDQTTGVCNKCGRDVPPKFLLKKVLG